MSRQPTGQLPADLRTCVRRWVTPAQLSDHLGVKAATLRLWCRQGKIAGAKRRDPVGDKNAGDWMIPIEAAMLLEHRLGFDKKHTAA